MRLLSRLIAMAAFCSLPLAVLADTSVTSFSPSGTVKGVRQVAARFNGQMVPLGDMRLGDPFSIDCPEEGKGRWIDGQNWSYDFARDLPAGVACRFTLKDDVKDLSGKPLAGTRQFSFDTGGPAIVEAAPREGSSRIDEQQIFVLGLDAPASDETVAAQAWCRAEGINERIGVRVLQGAERQQVLDLRKSFTERYLSLYFKARGVVWRATTAVNNKKLERLPLAVLQCKRSLPAATEVSLVWGAGIKADSGIATTQDQTLSYKTRPDFTARFSCDRLSADAGCVPFLPMRVQFSAPVKRADALAVKITGPGGKVFKPTLDKEEEKSEYLEWLTFKGPFPESARLTVSLPAGVKDDAGRALLNQARFPMAIRTDAQPPLVKFPARFGIIEAKGDKLLPVTLRNVEAQLAGAKVDGAALRVNDAASSPDQQDQQVIAWLKRMGSSYSWEPQELHVNKMSKPLLDVKAGKVERFSMPKPGGAKAFEVVGIPLRKPGFYVVELASPKLGTGLALDKGPAYVSSAALVTNMVAHFKHGAESSLVWVTSLDKGQPVAQAQVAVRDYKGALLWQGMTDSGGLAHIRQELVQKEDQRFFISARLGGDMTFTLSDWDRGIETWRFNLPTGYYGADNVIASTVFDRTLLRAGETVHMKHFLRRHVEQGLVRAAKEQPASMFIIHEGSGQQYELPLKWSANGSAENNWPIPADAKQGWYQLMIGGRGSGRFRVEQFRVPTMKALLQGPKAPAVQASSVDLDVQLSYLSGGGAGDAPVQLRTVVQNKSVSFEDYADFSFSAGDVKVGVEQRGGSFDDDEGMFEGEEDAAAAGAVRTRSVTLDKAGGARVTLDQLPAVQTPHEVMAEMTWQDANGETLSAATRIPLWPSSYVIGIQPDGWVASKDALKFTVAVLDLQGRPVSDAPVAVDIFQRQSYSHRRRLIGGFYAYENSSEVKALGAACEGKTDGKGLLICQIKAPASGNLILRAKTQDAQQRVAVTNRETWVADGADWWFAATDNDRIDLLPEKKRYEPGDTATFQVRMPFREATALITVEREGVIDTYVRPLSGSEPVFSIPVKKQYAPNVYVSALVVRGRVNGVQPTALVDLGKPAYKLGIAPLRVGWSANELKVQVKADKDVYKVRDKATVAVKVTRPDGSVPPAGAEVALAAVDVGLLELMPNTSWDLLEAMMEQRNLQVSTATAQMQVVGKRHFGRKAVPAGGGGGKGAGRELFDTLLFWKARVTLDANGEATVQVPINDSLTAFRIVAVASAQADLFGTGRTEVRSSQDLILLSGLPSMVREGDRFRATFTLRNTTDAAVKATLRMNASASGAGIASAATAGVGGKPLPPQSVTLEPGQAREVGWDAQAPLSAATLAWDVSAAVEGGGPASSDRIKITQKIVPAVPVTVMQATLLQLDRKQSMAVKLPDDALPGRGGVQVQYSPKLGGELPGVRDYMLQYPYRCFEQMTSRSIALHDEGMWNDAAEKLPAYLDADGLVKYFAQMDKGSDTLTAYVLSAASEAGYTIPDALKGRMESALLAFVQGKVVRYSSLPTADLAVRKIAALEALSRSRPVTASELESFSVQPNLWPTSAVIDWYQILQRSPKLPQHAQRLKEADQILRSRLNLQGTTMTFSTERTDDWWWLMSSADSNANRLLLVMADNPAWKDDIGRLARGALGRQKKGRWGTTVANAWGVLGMDKFSRLFESEKVTGTAGATLANASKSIAFGGGGQLELEHTGAGKPWATVQTLSAVPLKAPLSSGYKIAKTITPLEQKTKGVWSRGDTYRVHLDLEAQSDMTWVVVDDPIPASATVLGSGLGGDSQISTSGERATGWAYPAFQERSFEGYRAFYAFVPKGKWSVEYTVRLNNPGQFNLPPTRVEAMYSPEMFGAAPNAAMTVK